MADAEASTQTQLDKAALENELKEKGQGFSPQWLRAVLARGITSRPEIRDPQCKGLMARVEADRIVFRWYVRELFTDGREPKSRGLTIGEFTVGAFPGKVKLEQARGWVVTLREANGQRRLAEVEQRLESEKALRPEYPKTDKDEDAPGGKTVAEAAQDFYDNAITSGANARRKSQWRHAHRALFTVIVPALSAKDGSSLPLSEVTAPACGTIVKGLAKATPNWAGKVAQNMSQLFNYCQANGWLASNPCDALNFRGLGASSKGKKKKRFLAPAEIRAFWHGLDAVKPGSSRSLDDVTIWALRFCLVIPDRSGELLLSARSEFDLDAGIWTVPVAHQKLSTPQQKDDAEPLPVPLPPLAIAIVRKLFALNPQSKWTLPSKHAHDGRLNVNSLHQACRERFGDAKGKHPAFVALPGGPMTPHDLRKTFGTLCEEDPEDGGLGLNPKHVEACLSHTLGKGKIERTYRLGKLVRQRRATLTAWAEFVAKIVGVDPTTAEPRPALHVVA